MTGSILARDADPTGFTAALEALLEAVPDGLCATFLDAEGETIDLATRVDPYEARVYSAELALPLASLRDANIPCAVGSSTDRANIDLIMELTGLAPFFNTITAAADVKHGKPAPDVFLHAAASIGIDPHLCVVIEDAHAGIEAALAANCKAVAVATTHPVNSFPTAHLSLASLADLSLADLKALWPAP